MLESFQSLNTDSSDHQGLLLCLKHLNVSGTFICRVSFLLQSTPQDPARATKPDRWKIHLPQRFYSQNSALIQCCYLDFPASSDTQPYSLHRHFHSCFSSARQQCCLSFCLPVTQSINSTSCKSPKRLPRAQRAAHSSSFLFSPSHTHSEHSFQPLASANHYFHHFQLKPETSPADQLPSPDTTTPYAVAS